MTLSKNIHVLIVDDHQIVIDGIRALLKGNPQVHIAGEALHGQDALKVLVSKPVDIIILDIKMPIMDGVELTRIVKEKYPTIKVLILTMYDTPEFVRQAIEIDADGYILKNRGAEELDAALEALTNDKEYFGDEANKTLRAGVRKRQNMQYQEIPITKRELEVLRLIAEGKTTPQIADQLCIANSTVETHKRNLIEKTGVENATKGLMKFAIKNGYV
ncbi:response regulator transcription factor [Aquimarina pacifica]|uniref:response regulator transcription factor n=1 Tax=Aquimarina pacifica TaxID=1296415 RepID=UPI00046FE175|nr:response regulator transcription factor [Aquimarina pacifica]